MNHASEPSSFERRSAPLLLRLSALPRWSVVAGIVGLLAAGLFLPGWPGAVVLGVLAVFLGWLALLSRSRLSPAELLLRVITVGLVVAAAVSKVW